MVPSTAIWPRSKKDWSRIAHRFRNNFDLSAVSERPLSPEGDMFFGWTGQTIGRGRDRRERPRPAGLEKFDAKTSRGPQHFTGPPRDETDITQNKKIRHCVFAVLPENDLELFLNRSFPDKK